MLQTCFDGRYMLLLMALAAIYCGALYNEVFSVPLDIFGSRWQYYGGEQFAEWTNPGIAYPFGVDPAWKGAKNELVFYNSIKMKLSIIFGVVHMVLGIVLSAFNGVYFKKPYNIWFEFVPQLCFMLVRPLLHCSLVFHVVSC
jgi:V-type H+-transporting ATPase subunit a